MLLSKDQLLMYVDELIFVYKAKDANDKAKDKSITGKDAIIQHLENIKNALVNLP